MGFGGYAAYGVYPPHHPMFGRGGAGPPMSRDQYEAMMRGAGGRRSHARYVSIVFTHIPAPSVAYPSG
jgi:hypothetical protein